MNDASTGKADWQVALEHHEELCAERYNSIDRRFDAVNHRFDAVDRRLDNLEADMRELRREMRAGQRWIVGLILAGYFAWPTALIAFLKFFS